MKQCPICHGTGKVLEDSQEYEFITRDPATNRCLYCDGKGLVGARKKLPEATIAPAAKPRREPNPAPPAQEASEKKRKAGRIEAVTASLTLTGPAAAIIEMIRSMGGEA